jgi:hypothetical protein
VPDVSDIWRSGDPPTREELLRYLVTEYGLTENRAQAIVDGTSTGSTSSYADALQPGPAGGPDINSPEKLQAWIEGQIPADDPYIQVDRTAAGGVAGMIGEDFGALATHEGRQAARAAEATRVADETSSHAQRVRERFYKAGQSAGFDAGPAMDPAALSQSLAIGVFTDASGNVKIDPNTGEPVQVTPQTLWDAIRSQTFDMGELSMPRAGRKIKPRLGRRGEEQDMKAARLEQIGSERRRFVTPSMAMALLGSMPGDYLTHLQQQLWEAGLFGEDPPSWGVADDATRRAYMALFAEASLTPDDTIDRVLSRLGDEAITRGQAGGQASDVKDVPAFKPEVTSKATLSKMIDELAQNLTGAYVDDDTKNALIAKLQGGETDTQKAQYDRDVATTTGGGGQLDAFMQAIGEQESGGSYTAHNPGGAYGKYQIMPSNWGPWAERAGLGRNAPRTPENQEIVARHVMSEYYQRFGNWRDVAIAWFAGPGAVHAAGAENRSDGNMTVRSYADKALQRMAELGAGGTGGVGAASGSAMAPIETFDPGAEAEAAIKAQDPAGWQGHEWANRATEFYQLLGGIG